MALGSLTGLDQEDLTARARIRDAALRLFAEHGGDGTTIRDIAADAGVSGGLVRHHFGSKDDLRAACDAYALDQMMRIKERILLEEGEDRTGAGPAFLSDAHPAMLLLLQYFARSMVDGSPAADAMFEEMVDLSEAWLSEHHGDAVHDPRASAALLVAQELGVLAFRRQLSHALGSDTLERDGQLRLMRAKVDYYAQPFLDPEQAAQAHAALDQLQQDDSHHSLETKGGPTP
jgi:TetR/AcrR family transcriptional regulator, regulator of cefoperazone and chloramphenicol sensitivity